MLKYLLLNYINKPSNCLKLLLVLLPLTVYASDEQVSLAVSNERYCGLF